MFVNVITTQTNYFNFACKLFDKEYKRVCDSKQATV